MSANAPSTPRGPIRVSGNGRYFMDAGGAPFFWLADTAWPLFGTYTREEAEAYLHDRASRGFSVIQAVGAWGEPDRVTLECRAPAGNYAGHRPWLGSPAEPNPRYWENVDHLVGLAEELGLTIALVPAWGWNINQGGAFDEGSAFAYGRWVGDRYRAQSNLVWINGGDREPLGFEGIYRALAHGLRAGDGGAHLLTYHPCGTRSSSYYWHDEDRLDFNMIQTWTEWMRVHPMVAADYGLVPSKPVVLGEGAYELGTEYPLGPITPLVVRRQAWWAFTAGGFFTYGQNQMWRMEPGWLDTLDTPGAQHVGAFRRIATARRWWDMVPDQSLVFNGSLDPRTLTTSMRTRDRMCGLVYLADACHVVLSIERIAAPTVRVTWINPQTAEEFDGGTYGTGNGLPGAVFPSRATQCFTTPPFWEDAVLILDGCDAVAASSAPLGPAT
jgi:hypothetical protein